MVGHGAASYAAICRDASVEMLRPDALGEPPFLHPSGIVGAVSRHLNDPAVDLRQQVREHLAVTAVGGGGLIDRVRCVGNFYTTSQAVALSS
jgi:hypothetical protein